MSPPLTAPALDQASIPGGVSAYPDRIQAPARSAHVNRRSTVRAARDQLRPAGRAQAAVLDLGNALIKCHRDEAMPDDLSVAGEVAAIARDGLTG